MRLLLVFALFAVSAYCQELVNTGFKQCGTREAAEVLAVNIDPCDRDGGACILKKSTRTEKSFSTISIKFKAKRATELPVFSRVYGKISNTGLPFTVIPTACKKVEKPEEEDGGRRGGRGRGRGRGRGKGKGKGRRRKHGGHEVVSPLDCPLEEGQEYTFSYKLPISRFYPKLDVVVEWNLLEGRGKKARELVCVQMNTKLA